MKKLMFVTGTLIGIVVGHDLAVITMRKGILKKKDEKILLLRRQVETIRLQRDSQKRLTNALLKGQCPHDAIEHIRETDEFIKLVRKAI